MAEARRNRVTPTGELVATPLRGAWTGNRGILHRGDEVVRSHTSDRWIVCALEFRGERARQWAPGHWTPLFFHDEAVALAAGHRPCARCRRGAYGAFRDAWAAATGTRPGARAIDRTLHAERVRPRTHVRRTHATPWADVVPGSFVLVEAGPALVTAGGVVPWSPSGYGRSQARPPRGLVDVLTPPSTVAVLRAGYPVQVSAC